MRIHQEGASGLSIIIIVGLLVFVASIVFKVVPVYVDDASIKKVVASFHGKTDKRGKSQNEILRIFNKLLKVNNVTSISDDDVEIYQEGNDYVLIVEYEPRGTLFGSLDFIVSFKHEATFPAQ